MLVRQPWHTPDTQVVFDDQLEQSLLVLHVFLVQVPTTAPEQACAVSQSEFEAHEVGKQLPDLQVPHQPQSEFFVHDRATHVLVDPEHRMSLVHWLSLLQLPLATQVP